MEPRKDHEQEHKTAQALRDAVNAAIKAGNSPEVVRAIVADQLFGIARLGGGDVDALLKLETEWKKPDAE